MIMAWRQTEKPVAVKVNQKLTEEFAGRGDIGMLAFERPLSKRRANAYKKLMKEGKFRDVAWAKCFCKEDGHWWRINGQTTSTAALELFEEGLAVEFYVILETYEADTLKDVRELWERFDAPDVVCDFSGVN
jgi:hypothetical protein